MKKREPDIKKRDIEYYRSLSYDVIVRREAGKITLLIPELSIIVVDTELQSAFARLEEEKEAYLSKMCSASMDSYINEPYDKVYKEKLIDRILPFFIKMIALSLAIIIFTTIAVEFVKIKFDNIRFYTVRAARDFILNDIGDMTDEKREKIREKLHEAAVRLKPFVNELKFLFSEDSPEPVRR